MKKQYCTPIAYKIYGDDLLQVNFDEVSKGGTVDGETGKGGSAKENIFVWDDDFDGEDDNWGYSGF